MDRALPDQSLPESAPSLDVFPGTEIMLGPNSANDRSAGIVLSPQPSKDPRDPLNWSRRWKYGVITTQFLFLFVAVESALSMGPMFPLFAKEFSLGETEQSLLTGVCVLALGFSNFIIVPCSNILGRRITSLVLCLLGAGTCIWQALASTYSSLLAARVVNGAATATSETLLVQVVSDMFFLHERGLWTGVYFMGYFLGLFIGPVISGNIAQRFGWRSFFWLSLAMTLFNFVTLLLFFPETKFQRPVNTQSELSCPAITSPEEGTECKPDCEEVEDDDTVTSLPMASRGRPCAAQFRLWQKPDPQWKAFIVRDVFTPMYVFIFPIIFWAGLNVAGPANVLLYWNLTQSPVLSAPPYQFTPSEVGYSNFAFVVGGIIGLATAGPLSDWVAIKATNRNSGIREAEMRLPALIPFLITTVVGIVIGGVGYDRQWDWPVVLVVGYGLSGLCVTAVPTIAIAYAIDCYRPISGEIMVVATVIKNTCGFAMSYWVSPLAAREGWISPTMVEFALTVGPMLLGIPIYLFGKSLRRLTRNSKVHMYKV